MALNNGNSSSSNSTPVTSPMSPSNDFDNKPSTIVRIDQDSDDNFQALFDSVLKPGEKKIMAIPFRMRNLPESFFQPPTTGSKSPSVSHSRENSIDSALGGSTGSTFPEAQSPAQNVSHLGLNSRLTISHSRAHSSPASLQKTYAVGQKLAAQQQSNSSTNNNSSSNSNNASANNKNNSSNSSASANNSSVNSSGNSGVAQQQQQAITTPLKAVHASQRSYDVVSAIQLQEELGDLPPGWEQARTPEGQIYYLNHITRTTQWEDPRKQLQAQQNLVAHQSADSLLRSPQQAQPQQPTLAQQQVSKLSASTPIVSDPLPDGWEQAMTSAGEIYFINHINRTTSWFDPRITDQIQRIENRIEMLSGSGGAGWLNIRNLQKEREYLKQRQQEIQHQDLLTRQNQQTMGLQMDPFLSGATDHTRQESADSGLSLSSNPYSMSQTPDFLANMDDSMDCISESGNLDSLSANLENTDDLVPSLQLSEGFTSDILDDVHNLIDPTISTGKPDGSLTWI